jgi:hypothetical protein
VKVFVALEVVECLALSQNGSNGDVSLCLRNVQTKAMSARIAGFDTSQMRWVSSRMRWSCKKEG